MLHFDLYPQCRSLVIPRGPPECSCCRALNPWRTALSVLEGSQKPSGLSPRQPAVDVPAWVGWLDKMPPVQGRSRGWGRAAEVRGSWAQHRAVCTLHEHCNQIKATPASFLPTCLCFPAHWLHAIQGAGSKMAHSICTGWLCRERFKHQLMEREAGRQQWQARQSCLTRLFPFGGKLVSHIHHKPREKKSIGQWNHKSDYRSGWLMPQWWSRRLQKAG